MHMSLEVKRYFNFFWMRAIRGVRIDRCCIDCFKAVRDNRVYNATRCKSYALVDLEIEEDPKAIAYYLCGISAGSVWRNNVHVAFLPAAGETICINDEQIGLIIKGARRIPFNDYKPNPPGDFTPEQRRCRNWIFANYVLDGMLEKDVPHEIQPEQLRISERFQKGNRRRR